MAAMELKRTMLNKKLIRDNFKKAKMKVRAISKMDLLFMNSQMAINMKEVGRMI